LNLDDRRTDDLDRLRNGAGVRVEQVVVFILCVVGSRDHAPIVSARFRRADHPIGWATRAPLAYWTVIVPTMPG